MLAVRPSTQTMTVASASDGKSASAGSVIGVRSRPCTRMGGANSGIGNNKAPRVEHVSPSITPVKNPPKQEMAAASRPASMAAISGRKRLMNILAAS